MNRPPLPAPFNDPAVCEKLETILVRFGVDDRVMHAILYQMANVIAEKK